MKVNALQRENSGLRGEAAIQQQQTLLRQSELLLH